MSTRKPTIPEVPPMDAAQRRVLQTLKENVEIVTGRRSGAVAQLETGATLEQVVVKVNELLQRLQD